MPSEQRENIFHGFHERRHIRFSQIVMIAVFHDGKSVQLLLRALGIFLIAHYQICGIYGACRKR